MRRKARKQAQQAQKKPEIEFLQSLVKFLDSKFPDDKNVGRLEGELEGLIKGKSTSANEVKELAKEIEDLKMQVKNISSQGFLAESVNTQSQSIDRHTAQIRTLHRELTALRKSAKGKLGRYGSDSESETIHAEIWRLKSQGGGKRDESKDTSVPEASYDDMFAESNADIEEIKRSIESL